MTTKIEFPRSTFRHKSAPEVDREWLLAFVEEHGEREAARETGLSRATIVRAVAGLGVHKGSVLLIRAARERATRAA